MGMEELKKMGIVLSETQRAYYETLTEEQQLDMIGGILADREWEERKRNIYTTRELMQDREETRRIDGWRR